MEEVNYLKDIPNQKIAENLLRLQHDLSIEINKSRTINELLGQVLETALKMEGFDSGVIYLKDPETGWLHLQVHRGLSNSVIEKSLSFSPDSPQNQLIIKGEPLYRKYSEMDDSLDIQKITEEGLKAIALIPVIYDEQVIATLMLASHEYIEIPFTSRNFIESISGIIGSSIIRIWAESALRRSEKRYRMLIENIPYVTWIYNPCGKIIFISENIKDHLGYTQKDMYETDPTMWRNRIHPDDVEVVQEARMKLLEKKEMYQIEYRIKHKDGTWIWFYDRAIDTFREDDHDLFFGMFSNISEQKEMEEHRKQMEKLRAIGQLAGGIAHDFNNQLTAILNYTELLMQHIKNDEQSMFFIKNILSAVKHSSNLTSQLLAFSRKGKYKSEVIDIHEIIHEIILILTYTIDKKIKIKKYFNADQPFIDGDPSQLQNAILNLALNSRDAMPNGGEITFTTKNVYLDEHSVQRLPGEVIPGDYIELTVMDNGSGMNDETMKHMFVPFYTTKKQGEGSGMGLAEVYGTVKYHKGAIIVESRIDVGTTIKTYFPQTEKTKTKTSYLSTTDSEIVSKGHAHILFVDDEGAILSSMQNLLSRYGYKVSVCKDGVEACDFYTKNWKTIDLVVLDMIMPRMSGTEAFLLMRNINPDIKAYLLSGYSEGEKTELKLKQGILGFIKKPFNLNDFLKKIEAAMQRE